MSKKKDSPEVTHETQFERWHCLLCEPLPERTPDDGDRERKIENARIWRRRLAERFAKEQFCSPRYAAFVQHLATHGVAEDAVKAAKGRLMAHLDGRDFYQNDDLFTLADGREFLVRQIRSPRRGRMY